MSTTTGAKTRRFVASVSVEKTCPCGATFTRNRESRALHCPACCEGAADRVRRQRAARHRAGAEAKAARERNSALTCGECRAPLLEPAARCGFCIAEMNERTT